MRFGIRSLLGATFVFGLLLHIAEALRGQSAEKLPQLFLVFILGAMATVFFASLGSGIAGKTGTIVGASLGAIFWMSMLCFLHIFDGEVFRFIWVQGVLLVTSMIGTIWGILSSTQADEAIEHSSSELLNVRSQDSIDASR